jgi:hypothetical protein
MRSEKAPVGVKSMTSKKETNAAYLCVSSCKDVRHGWDCGVVESQLSSCTQREVDRERGCGGGALPRVIAPRAQKNDQSRVQ